MALRVIKTRRCRSYHLFELSGKLMCVGGWLERHSANLECRGESPEEKTTWKLVPATRLDQTGIYAAVPAKCQVDNFQQPQRFERVSERTPLDHLTKLRTRKSLTTTTAVVLRLLAARRCAEGPHDRRCAARCAALAE